MSEVEQTKKNKWTLIAIVTMSMLPITAAYLAYFLGIGVPDDTVNNGVLLPKPVHVKDLFESDDHQVVTHLEEDKKFRIFIPIGETCDETCQESLYTTRQVHIRLNEKAERLERYAINIGGTKGRDYLESIAKEHPRLKVAEVSLGQWQAWLNQSGAQLELAPQHYYLMVDQEGWAMMSYTDQHGNDLLKDLKRLLKYTIDYQK